MKHAFLTIAVTAYAFAATALEPATVTVSGAVQPPLTLTTADLKAKQVILAYQKDGAALDRPRRVVPGDAHAARGVHDVVTIEVK